MPSWSVTPIGAHWSARSSASLLELRGSFPRECAASLSSERGRAFLCWRRPDLTHLARLA